MRRRWGPALFLVTCIVLAAVIPSCGPRPTGKRLARVLVATFPERIDAIVTEPNLGHVFVLSGGKVRRLDGNAGSLKSVREVSLGEEFGSLGKDPSGAIYAFSPLGKLVVLDEDLNTIHRKDLKPKGMVSSLARVSSPFHQLVVADEPGELSITEADRRTHRLSLSTDKSLILGPMDANGRFLVVGCHHRFSSESSAKLLWIDLQARKSITEAQAPAIKEFVWSSATSKLFAGTQAGQLLRIDPNQPSFEKVFDPGGLIEGAPATVDAWRNKVVHCSNDLRIFNATTMEVESKADLQASIVRFVDDRVIVYAAGTLSNELWLALL